MCVILAGEYSSKEADMGDKTDKPDEVIEEQIAEPKQPEADTKEPKKPIVPKLLPEIVEPKTGGFRFPLD